MNATGAPIAIGPQAYDSWRATPLGVVTKAIEHRVIRDLVDNLAGVRLLDAGCSDGALVRAPAAHGAVATGVDPDPAMLAAARSSEAQAGIQASFVEGRVERLAFPDSSFNAVLSVAAPRFVPDAAGAIRELARVLRLGGRSALGELGRWSTWPALRRMRSWLDSTTRRNARFRTQGELRGLAEHAGLSVIAVRGAVFYPPTDRLTRRLAAFEARLGRLTTLGAAFMALSASKVR